jgi:hypothetical protein
MVFFAFFKFFLKKRKFFFFRFFSILRYHYLPALWISQFSTYLLMNLAIWISQKKEPSISCYEQSLQMIPYTALRSFSRENTLISKTGCDDLIFNISMPQKIDNTCETQFLQLSILLRKVFLYSGYGQKRVTFHTLSKNVIFFMLFWAVLS